MNDLHHPYAPPAQRLDYAAFEFSGAELAGRDITLRYRLSGGAPAIDFTEILTLPAEIPAPDPADPIVAALLDGVHRAFGVSYYKTAAPSQVIAAPVSDADSEFWNLLYGEGLGEFRYRNQLHPRLHAPKFPAGGKTQIRPATPLGDERALVLIGGGKDSAVAREVVRHAGVPADGLSLGSSYWQERSAAAMGIRQWVIRRQLDPQLFDLNRNGALNGHIPISACIAFIAALAAYAGGYSAVIAANERSADENNLDWDGLSVNHQWSKSFAFEQQFQAWLERRIDGGPRYFSLLRPLSELRIAEAFARHPHYFDHFASCNANFRHQPAAAPPRWCGHCPKCLFVQLILAPFLDPATVERIFGADFLNQPENRPLLEELLGVRGVKPFECVGSPEETRAALAQLHAQGRLPPALSDWARQYPALATALADPTPIWNAARVIGGPQQIPKPWLERLHAYL